MATMKKEELEKFLRDYGDSPVAGIIRVQLAAMEGTKQPVVNQTVVPSPAPVYNPVPVNPGTMAHVNTMPAPVQAPVYQNPIQGEYVVPVRTFPPMSPEWEELVTTMNFTQRDNYFKRNPWQSREFYRKYPQLQYGSFGILGKKVCKFFGK